VHKLLRDLCGRHLRILVAITEEEGTAREYIQQYASTFTLFIEVRKRLVSQTNQSLIGKQWQGVRQQW
jgi:hypothetical protein